MSDGFADMITGANGFFAELAQNNAKEWFEPRKERYAATIRKPAELLGEVVGVDLARLLGRSVAAKVYRIHRDVRFSKNKTPYNAHLHVQWTAGEGAPAWFFASSPTYLSFSTGVPDLESEALDRYRRLVDAKGDALAAAIGEASRTAGATLATWGAEPLKRVPKPFGEDHPHADLLRRKGLTLSVPLDGAWDEGGVAPTLARLSHVLLPTWRLLDEGLR